jgi:hypothetical protein
MNTEQKTRISSIDLGKEEEEGEKEASIFSQGMKYKNQTKRLEKIQAFFLIDLSKEDSKDFS